MKEKVVILRSGRAATQDPFRGPFAFPFALPEGGAELSTEVDVIDRGRIPSLTRDAGVLAVAPVIPMKLIAPVGESKDAATPAAQEVAWGVRAVGADTSPFTGNGIVVAVLDTGIGRR